MFTNIKRKVFYTAITVLLLANIFTLIFFWLHQFHSKLPMPPEEHGKGPEAFLIKELSLDSTQILQYRTLKLEHRKNANNTQQAIQSLKDSLFNQFNTNNNALKQHLLQQLGKKEIEMNETLFNHFKQLRALCNDEQKKKFDTIIKKAIHLIQNKSQQPKIASNPTSNQSDAVNNPPTNESNNNQNTTPPLPPHRHHPPMPPIDDANDEERLPPPPPNHHKPFPPHHLPNKNKNDKQPPLPPPPPNF